MCFLSIFTPSISGWQGVSCNLAFPESGRSPQGLSPYDSDRPLLAQIKRERIKNLIAHRLTDLLAEPATVGSRDAAFLLSLGCGNQITHAGGGPNPRELATKDLRRRELYIRDLHINTITVKSRNFP